jgi:phosphohistidine phosphatase
MVRSASVPCQSAKGRNSPMLTLSLFRHAKSSWANPLLDDFDRPLALRGQRSAPRTGAFIAERGLIPDLVLCSGSVRTRETLDLAMDAWRTEPEIVYDDALYHATVPALFAKMNTAPDEKAHVMMVGHNPGLHSFALQVVGSGDGPDLRDLAHGYPSGALAVITLQKTHWRQIKPGDGHLTLFVSPADLKAGS